VDKLTQAIRLGATYQLACDYAGITRETFYQWLNNKPDFSDAVKDAEGKGALGWLAKIEQAASDGNWQAAAWKLERRYPQMYGRQALEVTGQGGGPLKIEVAWTDEKPDEGE
jgi:transposase